MATTAAEHCDLLDFMDLPESQHSGRIFLQLGARG